MNLQSLGYVGFQGQSIAEWSDFATRLLGMQVLGKSETYLSLRMDDRKQRVMIDREGPADGMVFGWEVADGHALDAMAAHLEQWCVSVTRESAALADRRFVKELISFNDPIGNRLEIFHSPMLAEQGFRPGRNISGFRTGPLGMGHVVLTAKRIEDVMPFYVDVLGFRLSDFTLRPFRAFFFHINARHHSFALVETGRNGMHHLMVELLSLDDVGQGYDLAQADPDYVRVTLGRHTNDFMTSFYAQTPGEFFVEYGWGGRDIDVDAWQPSESTSGPSLWGHERSWLKPEERAEARALRMNAAAKGLREPVQVLQGNFNLMSGACPWWDKMMNR